MTLLRIVLSEIWWYGPLVWAGFAVVAFCATRSLGWVGILLSGFLIAVALFLMDISWIFDDMRGHPENSRDADFIFMFGVVCRITIFNAMLLPVSFLGWWISPRRRSETTKSGVA